MFRKYFIFIIILISVSALWGCQKKPAAVVNGEAISEEKLQRTLQDNIDKHGDEGAKVDPATLRSAVLNQMISELLLLQGALEAGITVPEADVQYRFNDIRNRMGEEKLQSELTKLGITKEGFIKMLRERMLKERFVEQLLDQKPVSDEHLLEYYKNSPKPFLRPAEGNLRFIQFTNKADAEDAVQHIKEKKETFDAIADRLEKSGEAIVSRYSWVSPDMFSPNIRDALKHMKIGSVEGPLEGGGGIYLFRLADRRPEKIKSFEEAKEEIRRTIRNEKKAAVVIQWVSAKRKESTITVN